MTTQTNEKIRLVRCPKCIVVLPEPDIPVYICGGCGAVLKAKSRKTSTTGTHGERETNGSSGEATVFARGESSSLSDSGSNRNEDSGQSEGATVFARGELLSDSSSYRNEDSGQNEEATAVARGEPSSDSGSDKIWKGISKEATVIAREEPSSDSGSDGILKGVNNEATVVARGEPSSDSGSDKIWKGVNQEAIVVPRVEPSSDSGTDRDQENGVNQAVTDPAREPLPVIGSTRSQDKYLNEEALSDTGSTNNHDICLNLDTTVSAGGETQPDVSISGMEPGAEKLSPQLANLPEAPSHENPELTSESAQKMEQVRCDYIGDVSMRVYRTESCIGGRSFSDDFFSSREFLGLETEDSSPELELKMALHDTKSTREQTEGKVPDENGFSTKGSTLEDVNGNMYLALHGGSSNGSKFGYQRREIPQDSNPPINVTSSTEVSSVLASLVVDTKAPVYQDSRVYSLDHLGKNGSFLKEESGSVAADENPSSGIILSDNVDSDDQHLGGNFGLKNRELSKSPTKRYYGHDGGASSYDGFGERISARSAKPPRRKFKQANSNLEGGSRASGSRTDNHEMQYKPTLGSRLNDMLSDEAGVRYQARKPPMLPEKTIPSLKYRATQDDLHDPRSFGHSGGNRMRDEVEEHNSNFPFPAYLQTGQRKPNPSPYSGLSDVPSYTEPGKMELLRVVNELKEELKRMHISNSRFPLTVTREEKYNPLYYDDHLAPVEETSSEMRFSRNRPRYSQGKALPLPQPLHWNKPPRIAFSGDATDFTRHVDCGCRNCHPQDRHYSVQLPSHAICSTFSSPPRYKSSEFSDWDRDAIYVDQWNRDNGIRNMQLRERYQSMKRHVMPVVGGNPFISCYHCSELLQIPADFLVMGRRCHKLRCSACGKVLKFSLQSGKHTVPFVPDANAIAPPPPPSMVDGSSGRIPRVNWESTSHSNDHRDVEPYSYDEYGISFERSISTEAEASMLPPPVHHVGKNSLTRKMSSEDYLVTSKDWKMKSVEDPSVKKSKGQKASSRSKEVKENGGSPLHRLMGYSSPSAVMRF